MKKFNILILLFILASTSIFAQDSTEVFDSTNIKSIASGSLTIILLGIESDEGKMMIAVSDTRENYEDRSGEPTYAGIAKIKEGKAKITFENIPFGEYAVKAFHDEDDDDEMDTNFIGMPSESYGFSNDATGSFGPADFDDAKFKFDDTNKSIEININ